MQFPPAPNTTLGVILQIIFLVLFIIFMFFGQRIQVYTMLKQVEGSLNELKFMRDEGRKIAIKTLQEAGGAENLVERVDQFLEHVAIQPESMDPAGVVWKLEHIMNVREDRFLEEVRRMAPKADEVQLRNLEHLLEASLALNLIYKTIRHYFLLGKKTLSLYIIMQLQMLMPLILREARAYASALNAFVYGHPIGDGVGSLVAAKLMRNHEIKPIAKDIVMAEVEIEGRHAYIIKAEGPGSKVGKPGDAVRKIIEENNGKIAAIIFIDAALKLEGEKVGEIAEAIGVAIGGVGIEKYKVEDIVTKYKIPVHAVIIKEDVGDAISPMSKEIFKAADAAIERIKALLLERTKEGDKVIIAGIGNTMGIGQ